jgi:hypothetical protein
MPKRLVGETSTCLCVYLNGSSGSIALEGKWYHLVVNRLTGKHQHACVYILMEDLVALLSKVYGTTSQRRRWPVRHQHTYLCISRGGRGTVLPRVDGTDLRLERSRES